eukprot:2770417-Rhodomonas_salina.1
MNAFYPPTYLPCAMPCEGLDTGHVTVTLVPRSAMPRTKFVPELYRAMRALCNVRYRHCVCSYQVEARSELGCRGELSAYATAMQSPVRALRMLSGTDMTYVPTRSVQPTTSNSKCAIRLRVWRAMRGTDIAYRATPLRALRAMR